MAVRTVAFAARLGADRVRYNRHLLFSFLRHAGPKRRRRRSYGDPGCIRLSVAGYTPQISQRRAHGSGSGGWHNPRTGSGRRQEEEQLWGSR